MNFATIDYIFIGIIGIFALFAAIKGFVKAIFGKLCWIVGLLIAAFMFKFVTPLMQNFIENKTLASISAFVVVFLISFIVIKIIEIIISKIFSGELLKSLDRALGFLFGILEGFVIVFVIIFVLSSQQWFDVSGLVDGSIFYQYLSPFALQTKDMIKDVA